MLFEVHLLAANAWEWIGPLVVVAFYILSHLYNATKNRPGQTPTARGPFAPPTPPPQSTGGKAQSRATKQPELNTEIEQFLRRASERRGEKQQREKPQRQFPLSQTSQPQSSRRPSDKPRSQNEPPKPPREQRPDLSSVAASVEEHLGGRGFEQREKKLAEDVVRSETQLEQHVQNTFSGRLGNLSSDTDTSGPLTDTQTEAVDDHTQVASELAASLANPQSIKQAIMLSEILTRPTERW